MSLHLNQLNEKGFTVVSGLFSTTELGEISRLIKSVHGEKELFGARHFLQRTPGLQELLLNDSLRKLLSEVAPGYFLIKSIYFDKPPHANWFVSFHQDKIIFVKEKIEAFGFRNWTERDGEFGVQPPAEYLGNIVTVRIHLDDADGTNGALKVIPYSHSEASLRPAAISFSDSDATICPVKAGGAMLMKPLLFHASSRATTDKPRRVIHLELCGMELPAGMEWSQKILF